MARKVLTDSHPRSPRGLTSHEALAKTISGIESALQQHQQDDRQQCSLWQLFREGLSASQVASLFPWPSIVAGLIFSILLLVAASLKSSWVLAALALLILLSSLLNGCLGVHEHRLRRLEIARRVRHVVNRLIQVKEHVHWSPHNYLHLHTPTSASIVLQWTIRDRKHVNLPWALLVKGDLILLKPGQAAPGNCHSVENPSLTMKADEILHIKTRTDEESSPTPEFKTPASPHFFVMDETPYLDLVRKVLQHENSRPPYVLAKHAHLFFTRYLVCCFLPASFFLVLAWNLLRAGKDWSILEEEDDVQRLLLEPLIAAIPLLPLSFPLAWVLTNYAAFAWVLGVYSSSRHVKVTDDPFDDTVEEPEIRTRTHVPLWKLRTIFWSALKGRGEYLSRTENLVHAFGSITALCCTDKKGILSWPNASPEKIFVMRKEESRAKSSLSVEGDSKKEKEGNYVLVPEILSVTNDRRNPFKVEFDDPSWSKYLNFLKPLGLGILLNTCNISTEEKYTNFYNHLVCESIRVEDEAVARRNGDPDPCDQGTKSAIDMVPIVTRGCLCELATKIGFAGNVVSQYSLSSQIQTFRRVQPNHRDKFARNLSLARLKFPFPHLVSVLVQHRTTGSRQLITQGTADIVLDSCADTWTGDDLEPLTEDLRKKIMDFYHRASLSSYCTAFSIKPQTFQLPWRNCREYLQLPTHSNPFYWQYTEATRCLDADDVASPYRCSAEAKMGGAAGDDDERRKREEVYQKNKDDAMICLEMECNQTFLGMIQLQYQAVVDFVQLIDLLEKACIRFVHFSKENELR